MFVQEGAEDHERGADDGEVGFDDAEGGRRGDVVAWVRRVEEDGDVVDADGADDAGSVGRMVRVADGGLLTGKGGVSRRGKEGGVGRGDIE